MRAYLGILFVVFIAGCGDDSRRGSGDIRPIAHWSFPDGVTCRDSVPLGVVAYHKVGVASVAFSVNDTELHTATSETINRDTGEMEFLVDFDSTTLEDGTYLINATVTATDGASFTLNPRLVWVGNHFANTTIHVDSENGSDETGMGTAESPFATLDGGLAAAQSGDTVALHTGEYLFDITENFGFNRFVTVTAHEGETPVFIGRTSPPRASYLKMVGLTFDWSDTAPTGPDGTIDVDIFGAYNPSHIWFKDCTFVGPAGMYNNYIRAAAFWGDSQHVTYENNHFAHVNLALVLPSEAITRGNTIGPITSDAFDFAGENILITGNTITDVLPPYLSIESEAAAPWNLGAGGELNLHYDEFNSGDYTIYTVNLSANSPDQTAVTMQEVLTALRSDEQFNTYFTAADLNGHLSISPRRRNYVQHLYVTGVANESINFPQLNSMLEAVGSGQHADIFQFWNPVSNIILRNNHVSNAHSQCFLGESRTEHLIMVNNLFEASGGPWAINIGAVDYENVTIAHNTIWNSSTAFLFREGIPRPKSLVIKNNVCGGRHSGGEPVGSGFEVDYNFYTLYNEYMFSMNENSVETNSDNNEPSPTDHFVDVTATWEEFEEYWDYADDFHLSDGAAAIDAGDSSLGISYDLEWTTRDASPDMGCYEFTL